MSDSTVFRATRVNCSVSDMEEERQADLRGGDATVRSGSDWGGIAMLDKTKEFFQTCDVEGKGFITRTDMRRLHSKLPLTAEELENVFDSLDTDSNSYLTLGEFTSGFSQFLHGRRISVAEEPSPAPTPTQKVPEALYQSQWEEKLTGGEDDEERHFSMLLDSLGASNIFEDPGEVCSLWAQLRKDEPQLLSNFEEFLARVTYQIKEATQERREMESALQRKAATHDCEIQRLYEEMELQIKNEKERVHHKDSERLQSLSQDLEHQLSSKEREMDQLFQKQRRLESQCRDLSSEQQESKVENVKLKMTNDELSRDLDSTCQELVLAQEQLTMLQEQAVRLNQEKEMEMYRVTEGLQREKQSLMKQLDLLREMNKHLKDERDICCSINPRNSLKKKQKQRAGLANLFADTSLPAKSEDDDNSATVCQQKKENSGLANGYGGPPPTQGADGKAEVKGLGLSTGIGKTEKTTAKEREMDRVIEREKEREVERAREREGVKKREEGTEVLDAPPDGWPLRRVISIEEDHLPHLLQGGSQTLLHQLSEEDEEEDEEEEDEEDEEGEQLDVEMSCIRAMDRSPVTPTSAPTPAPVTVKTVSSSQSARKSRFSRMKKAPTSPRGQPVGKETQHRVKEGAVPTPDRLFKVVLVGDSSVGKTSLLRSFCDGRFNPSTPATVGIDYSVKSLTLDNTQVAMQLWDTAGQERYRSITKQFFRRADGVVIMYDVTVEKSFKAVRPWLANVHEAAGEGIPILLLGNKMDIVGEREVKFKDAEILAQDTNVIFYEVSAYTGTNVTESMVHLARVLKEQEDRVRDTTVLLEALPLKKKACCN